MANYIAVPTKHVPDNLICHAVLPPGQTLHVGSVVALESIANARNYSVWTMTAPAADAKHVGIIVGAGIEELSDGRRPAGNVDWTTYTFKAGDVVTVVMLEKFMSFEISKDVYMSGFRVDAESTRMLLRLLLRVLVILQL